jgi:GTP-binding protein HflX
LHVIDASDPAHCELAENVETILAEIGADQIPCIRVYNKIDRLDEQLRLARDASEHGRSVWVSAASGTGLDALRDAIAERVRGEIVRGWVRLPPQEASRFRARLFSMGAVIKERLNPDGELLIEVQTSRRNLRQLCRREGFREEWMRQAS